MAYASGKKAWGISDRSGWRYRLNTMRVEWTGAKVGPDEWEEKQPQLNPPPVTPDPQAFLPLAYAISLPSNNYHWVSEQDLRSPGPCQKL